VYNNAGYRATMRDVHPDAMEILYGVGEHPLFSTGDVVDVQFYENLPEERLMLLNSLWEELKIDSPIHASIIVMAGAVLSACVGLGVYTAVRGYRRRRRMERLWTE
jgi:hypothetical protein